ncbi:MAG: AAA family ATPase [Acidimicrobiales bacterium]
MIQLRRATIENFRLLRDIELEFSTDFDRPLTIVRAENDTGKTTLLNALTWGLFGDDALPGPRSSFRLHPIDWNAEDDGVTVGIKVTIEFAVVDEETDNEVVYELERSASERLVGETDFEPYPTTVTLLRRTTAGLAPVDNPAATIESLLPASLRDVFFIDGDRALVFIETTDEQKVKRERVAKAVRSLLGLDLLEEAERHIDHARRDAIAAIRRLGAGTDLELPVERHQHLEGELAKLTDELSGLQSDRDSSEQRHKKADKRLKDALASGAGAQRELGVTLEKAEGQLDAERKREASLLGSHRRLLNAPSLIVALAPTPIATAASMLADLEERRVIPSTLPAVLEDRLARGECICGASLGHGSHERDRIEALLAEAREIDESKELLQNLNDGVKRTLRDLAGGDPWALRLRESQANIQTAIQRQRDLEGEVSELRAQIRGIKETNLEELERMVAQEEREVKRIHGDIGRTEQRIRQIKSDLSDVDRERGLLEKKNAKVRSGVAKETAAKDILQVIHSTVHVLQEETLDEVSAKMNEIFMAMIVADEETASGIRKAVLTRNHDIIVMGPAGRTIDPDVDLNGASRRALTLAFILALVKVSGVKAPNIIDTPLGMMGVEVRRAVVRYAAQHSGQLVLFLTGSEIVGVEDLLDEYVGKSYTFSNASHYPMKLLNDPGTSRMETFLCSCNHRQHCDLCRRRVSVVPELVEV